MRAQCYEDSGEYKGAICDLTSAIKYSLVTSEKPLLYLKRAYDYERTQKIDEAIADYSAAIALNPRLAVAYHKRGHLYRKKGGNKKAEVDDIQATELGFRQATGSKKMLDGKSNPSKELKGENE